jgi:hypothetical protein
MYDTHIPHWFVYASLEPCPDMQTVSHTGISMVRPSTTKQPRHYDQSFLRMNLKIVRGVGRGKLDEILLFSPPLHFFFLVRTTTRSGSFL